MIEQSPAAEFPLRWLSPSIAVGSYRDADDLQPYSLLIGDVVHNARSALDHAVWALATLNGGTPGIHTAFPVYVRTKDWTNRVVKPRSGRRSPLDGLTDAQIEVVRAHQPFATHPDNPEMAELWVLHWMWNMDKHRQIHPAQVMLPGDADPVATTDSDFVGVVGQRLVDIRAELHDGEDVVLIAVGYSDRMPDGHNPQIDIEVPTIVEFPRPTGGTIGAWG